MSNDILQRFRTCGDTPGDALPIASLLYDAIYMRLDHSSIFEDILHQVMGTEHLDGLAQFSFLKRADLHQIVAEPVRLKKTRRGLEIGCGLGGVTRELTRRTGGHWIGLDLSGIAVAAACRRGGSSKVSFVTGNMESIPFAASSFDRVVAIDTIQHATSYDRCANELQRVLVPGGLLHLTNWMMLLSTAELSRRDPLMRALVAHGFEICSTFDTDPRLKMQLQVYMALYECRTAVEDALGRDFLELMFREAGHLIKVRESVGRFLTVAVKSVQDRGD
jgi:ubiquinone/menaquinone biosynthesis C-methylase UbiE